MKKCAKLIIVIVAIIAFFGCVSYGSSLVVQDKEKVIKAYSDVLYSIWILNPDYVLDVLSETDEFQALHDALGDKAFNDIFQYRSVQDSITQANTPDPGCIDTPSPPAFMDSLKRNIDPIKMP